MADPIKLPEFQSHKRVRAASIVAIEFLANGSAKIAVRLPDHYVVEAGPASAEDARARQTIISTSPDYRHKFNGNKPWAEGDDLGYYVLYEDNYESWSPSAAFLSGYQLIHNRSHKSVKAEQVDAYLYTIERIEPDVAMIDPGAFYASAAISLKRMADAAEEQTKIARAAARAHLPMDDEWLKQKGLGDLLEPVFYCVRCSKTIKSKPDHEACDQCYGSEPLTTPT